MYQLQLLVKVHSVFDSEFGQKSLNKVLGSECWRSTQLTGSCLLACFTAAVGSRAPSSPCRGCLLYAAHVGLRRLGVSMASCVRTLAPSPPPIDLRLLEHGADVARREHGHGPGDLPAELLLPGSARGIGEHLDYLERALRSLRACRLVRRPRVLPLASLAALVRRVRAPASLFIQRLWRLDSSSAAYDTHSGEPGTRATRSALGLLLPGVDTTRRAPRSAAPFQLSISTSCSPAALPSAS